MPHLKWGSPLMHISSKGPKHDPESATVVTPFSGLYGFFFGPCPSGGGADFSSSELMGGEGDLVSRCGCFAEFHCSPDPSEKDDGATSTTEKEKKTILLPFSDGKGMMATMHSDQKRTKICLDDVHDILSKKRPKSMVGTGDEDRGNKMHDPDGKEKEIPMIRNKRREKKRSRNCAVPPSFLVSISVGRVIYLPCGTRVSVSRPTSFSSSHDEQEDTQQEQNMECDDVEASSSSSCLNRMCQLLRWKLVLHMEQQHIISNNNNSSQESNSIDMYPPQVHKKPLLCSKCLKRFPSTRAIQCHMLSSHKEEGSKIDQQQQQQQQQQQGKEQMMPDVLRHPLRVAYEDDVLVVVIKPQGVSVLGERWTLSRSDLFLPFMAPEGSDRPLSKPRIVHRLDSATGGLLIVAKTQPSEVSLKHSFEHRLCHKRYRAIVFGNVLKDSGRIDDVPIGGKEAITRYKVVNRSRCVVGFGNGGDDDDGFWMSTVDLYPETGRRHQLRRHLKSLGHPIWGDLRYGPYERRRRDASSNEKSDDDNDMEDEKRRRSILIDKNTNREGDPSKKSPSEDPHAFMCLWALEITFPHPITRKEIRVEIDEPAWYKVLRENQERLWSEKFAV